MGEFNERIGKQIKANRLERKRTRDSLAEDAKISSKFLYEIETGKKGLSAKTLYDIARALNISANDLLSEEFKEELRN